MKKIVFLLFLYLPIFGGNFIYSQTSKSNFKLEVENLNDLGKYERLVTDAINLLNDVFNSEEFKNEVLNYNFDWENLKSVYPEISNEEVLNNLIGFNDNYKMKLVIRPRGLRVTAYMYGTKGVTTLNSNKTRTYRHWLDLSPEKYDETVINYASHIAHEYSHQRGFSDKNSSPECEFRDVIPYAIGDIACEIINSFGGTNVECTTCS